MTTLAERRAWMRDGCPVSEPAPLPDPCCAFDISIDRGGGRLIVACVGCGKGSRHGSMIVGGPSAVEGVWPAVRDTQVWMVEHATPELGYTDAAKAFRDSEEDSGRMRRWAHAVMVGKDKAWELAGVIASPLHPDWKIRLEPYPC